MTSFKSEALNQYPYYSQLAFAYGEVGGAKGVLKASPEDFVVEENLGFELSGEGEHLWLYIKAIDMNTDFTVKQLARDFGVEKRAISYSGKKDRRAVTSQWFSIHLPGQDIQIPNLHENLEVLKSSRHSKKLRRGAHKDNQFQIRLTSTQNIDEAAFQDKLATIAESGYPNYFGPQRFGHGERNIEFAVQCMETGRRLKRQDRDRVYSTLRAWDFNRYLSLRINEQNWRQYLEGDLLMLSGSSSFFQPDEWDEELNQRLATGDIHIGGLLPGKGRQQVPLSNGVDTPCEDMIKYLGGQRVEQGIRALSVIPKNIQAEVLPSEIKLSFALPKGAYATSLLRELINVEES